MAFQAGEIKISGTFDDLSFYHSVFGWLVRRKGGPGRDQFKRSPSFARARENSAEFAACARAAASIRRLAFIHTGKKDKTLYHRLIKLMRMLADNDRVSVRGKRNPWKGMLTEQGQITLKEFKITGELSLYDVLASAAVHENAREVREPGISASPTQSSTTVAGNGRRKRKRVAVLRQFPWKLQAGPDAAQNSFGVWERAKKTAKTQRVLEQQLVKEEF
jgi:hypothetical protein